MKHALSTHINNNVTSENLVVRSIVSKLVIHEYIV